VFATPERTDLTGLPLNLLRIAITVVAALLSYYFLEQPIRRGVLRPRLARLALPVSIVVVLGIVLAGTATSETTVPPIERVNHEPGDCGAAQQAERVEAAAELEDLGSLGDRGDGLRVVVIGDSIACALLTGLEAVAETQDATVANAAILGCGVISGTVAGATMLPRAFTTECPARSRDRQERAIAATAPDAIVWWSDWETATIDADGRAVEVGTPAGDVELRRRMELAFERLHQPGVPIVILTVPPLLPSPAFPVRVESEDTKHHRLNELYREFAAAHPGDVVIVELAKKLCPSDPCPKRVDGFEPRPYDGLHLTPRAAAWASHWLWPQIAAAARP
jgi:hypothetical protein